MGNLRHASFFSVYLPLDTRDTPQRTFCKGLRVPSLLVSRKIARRPGRYVRRHGKRSHAASSGAALDREWYGKLVRNRA